MERSTSDAASGRGSEPRVIAQGVLDGDAVVYELFPMQTLRFDGRNSVQTIPFPVFDCTEYRAGVLSVLVKVPPLGFLGETVTVRIQHAIQMADDPNVIFVENAAAISITNASVAGSLASVSWPTVSTGARLRFDFSQSGPSVGTTVTLAVWLTLRST